MSVSDPFTAAASALSTAGPDDELCGPFVRGIAVTGAVISTLGRPLGSQTVCASDPTAARIDEIQLDLGEGPCWDSLRMRTPMLSPDLQRSGGDGWPTARDALRATRIGALYAFPLHVGAIDVGSVDLYMDVPHPLSRQQIENTTMLAGIAARQVLRRALAEVDDTDGVEGGAYSRREIHQATGMVAAQLRMGVDDAFLLLRGRAFADGRTVMEVADDVVSRRLIFSADD